MSCLGNLHYYFFICFYLLKILLKIIQETEGQKECFGPLVHSLSVSSGWSWTGAKFGCWERSPGLLGGWQELSVELSLLTPRVYTCRKLEPGVRGEH